MDCSNFWKLDKIDKIFISLICIIVALFSTLQCFAAEVEEVEYSKVSGLNFNNGVFNTGSNNIGYFEVEPGYKYTVTNVRTSGANLSIIGSNDIPGVGVIGERLAVLGYNDSYIFSSSSYNYLFLDFQGYINEVSVTREKLSGLESSVDMLVNNVGPGALWNIFETSLPYILVVVVVVLGFYFIRRMIRRISHGRSNL